MREVGRPYMLTDGYVEFLAVVRYLFCFPYRQLEGFTKASLSGLFRPQKAHTRPGPFTLRVSEALR